MFFPLNILVKESNIFGVFREDTYGTSLSVIESTMVFLSLIKFFLCKALSLISVWNWNLSTYVGVQFIFFREIKYFHAWKLSTDVIYHFEMRTSKQQKIRSYRFEVSVLLPELDDLGFVRETLIFKTWNLSDIIGQKYRSLQMDLSNVLFF